MILPTSSRAVTLPLVLRPAIHAASPHTDELSFDQNNPVIVAYAKDAIKMVSAQAKRSAAQAK